MNGLDEAAVERAASGALLRLPKGPQRGRVGEVRAASVGSSMEIHDFRPYQPGDDLRQIDWNAVARTDALVLRVRQDEVSPRIEVVLDGSRSMAVSSPKGTRAAELALLLVKVASRQGLAPTLLVTSRTPRRSMGQDCRATLRSCAFDAADDLSASLRRSPPLRPCGLRLVVSDFLFESPLDSFAELLARGASALGLVQVLDDEDTDPSGGVGARLVDSETGEVLERVLTAPVLESYGRRLAEHQKLLRSAAVRVYATLVTARAGEPIETLARSVLGPFWEGGR